MRMQVAGRMGMKEASPKCRPVLLEPLMAMEITAPEEQLGEVIGDINQKRGMVELMSDKKGGVKLVKCQVGCGDKRGLSSGVAAYASTSASGFERQRFCIEGGRSVWAARGECVVVSLLSEAFGNHLGDVGLS